MKSVNIFVITQICATFPNQPNGKGVRNKQQGYQPLKGHLFHENGPKRLLMIQVIMAEKREGTRNPSFGAQPNKTTTYYFDET